MTDEDDLATNVDSVIYDLENIEINRTDRNLDHAKTVLGILLPSILIIIGFRVNSRWKNRHI